MAIMEYVVSDGGVVHGLDDLETPIVERCVLVGAECANIPSWPLDKSLEELSRLADTAGAETVAIFSQKLKSPNPRTYIGSGKADEIAQFVKESDIDVVIFDDELTPSQQSNLERIIKGTKVIDRTALILDIFALHATSKEGRLQVRLAQNEYLLPRLRGMWAHLASNRMGGGVGSRFGEGESQLEVDRRIVRKRILSIKRELAELADRRSLQRKSRNDSGVFRVALAGYTNAGKSSLLNRLTGADVLAYDKLFATLDSTTRKLELDGGANVTLTDTVGFIQKLPTTLIQAFNSTLDEIREASLILFVIDSSSDQINEQMSAVYDTFDQISVQEIPCIVVMNKCDLLDHDERLNLANRFPYAQFVSAETGEGCEELMERIRKASLSRSIVLEVLIPYTEGKFVELLHRQCSIISETYEESGTRISVQVPPAYVSRLDKFVVRTGDDFTG